MNQRPPLYDPYAYTSNEVFEHGIQTRPELGPNHKNRASMLRLALREIDNSEIAKTLSLEAAQEAVSLSAGMDVYVPQKYIADGINQLEAHAQGDELDEMDETLLKIGYVKSNEAPTIEELNRVAQDATIETHLVFSGEKI